MSKIRSCFKSRFKDGLIVEADFAQLEVAALAFRSGDETLNDDIRKELDMHLVSASWVSGIDYDQLKQRYDDGDPMVKSMRTAAKQPRFELQYGAGYKTIARNNKWTDKKAKEYIARYYKRYPGVKNWQDYVAARVEGNKQPAVGFFDPLKDGQWISHYECPHTHRRYVFKSYKSAWKADQTFSPTQMKNYPVQGFATADFVPTMLGALMHEIYLVQLERNVLTINTIHDSILLDVDSDHKEIAYELINEVFDRSHEIMRSVFDCDIDVPLRYSIKSGSNWGHID